MKILKSMWNTLRVCFAPAPLLTEDEQLELIKKGSTIVLYLAIGKQKFSEKAEDLLITYMPSIAERKNYVSLATNYYSSHGLSNRQKLLVLENAPCVDKALVAQIRREFVSAWPVNTTDEENVNRVIFLLKCGDDEIVEAFKNIAAMVRTFVRPRMTEKGDAKDDNKAEISHFTRMINGRMTIWCIRDKKSHLWLASGGEVDFISY